MQAEEIEVGWRYKIEGAGCRKQGYYTVISVHKNKNDIWEVTAKHPKDSFSRTFRPEQIHSPEKKKNTRRANKMATRQVEGELLEEIPGPWPEGVKLWNAEITYWPDHKKRGRKKVTNDND